MWNSQQLCSYVPKYLGNFDHAILIVLRLQIQNANNKKIVNENYFFV